MENKKRILVLEDSSDIVEIVKAELERRGFEVVACFSVKKAREALAETGAFDAFWSDHYLGGGETGIDFVREVRNDKRYAKTPVFLVSVTATPEKIKEYEAIGIARYFPKQTTQMRAIVDGVEDFLKNGA